MSDNENTTESTPRTDADTPAIEFRHVSKEYDDVALGGTKLVLDDVSLSVARGEFVCVIGSSGGGKTTLLKMVNGLIEPTSGDVLVEGRNVRDVDLVQLRRNIGYAIQGSVLFPHMTVEQNIAFGLKQDKMPKDQIAERVEEIDRKSVV